MKKGITLSIILLFSILFFAGCGNKKKSNADLFRESYSKNLAECVHAAEQSGVEKFEAERKCACMLTKLYELDSTFVRKSDKEFDKLLEQHIVELYNACDSVY